MQTDSARTRWARAVAYLTCTLLMYALSPPFVDGAWAFIHNGLSHSTLLRIEEPIDDALFAIYAPLDFLAENLPYVEDFYSW